MFRQSQGEFPLCWDFPCLPVITHRVGPPSGSVGSATADLTDYKWKRAFLKKWQLYWLSVVSTPKTTECNNYWHIYTVVGIISHLAMVEGVREDVGRFYTNMVPFYLRDFGIHGQSWNQSPWMLRDDRTVIILWVNTLGAKSGTRHICLMVEERLGWTLELG